MFNWKIIVGILIIFGSVSEMISIITDYRSGKLTSWPFGADVACVAMVIGGLYLIRKGQNQKKRL
jgi:hypothetical protein